MGFWKGKNDYGFSNLNLEEWFKSEGFDRVLYCESLSRLAIDLHHKQCRKFILKFNAITQIIQERSNRFARFSKKFQACRKNAIKWERVYWNYYVIQRVNDPYVLH